MNRRSFLSGLGALVAAPAIVQASNLMPVRGIIMPVDTLSLDEFYERIMQPMIDRFQRKVADAIMNGGNHNYPGLLKRLDSAGEFDMRSVVLPHDPPVTFLPTTSHKPIPSIGVTAAAS